MTTTTELRPEQEPHTTSHHSHRLSWLWVLIGGAVVWIVAAGATAVTSDKILVPTLILVGSFLIPVSTVMFALSRKGEDEVPHNTLLLGFFLGGAVGVVVAATIETYLLPTTHGTFIVVGLVEELTKAGIVVLVASRMASRRPREGMVLGATVGAGFAAFESAGYAFATLMEHLGDHEVLSILQTEASRAILAPFGHILWTAIFGGALFAASRADGRFRLTWGLFGTVLGIITLHALWDQSYGWAILLTKGVQGNGWHLEWPATEQWIGDPTGSELRAWQVIYDGLLVINAAVGTWWVVHNWRRYRSPSPTTISDALEPAI